jgi:hypothetical protein
MLLKEYDTEIRDGIGSIVVSDSACLRQLYCINPKTFYRRKHALGKLTRLVWINTRSANDTSFCGKS